MASQFPRLAEAANEFIEDKVEIVNVAKANEVHAAVV